MSRFPLMCAACLTLSAGLALPAYVAAVAVDQPPRPPQALAAADPSGQTALDAMLQSRDELVMRAKSAADSADAALTARLNDQLQQLNDAIDTFAHQRYAHVSRLYWYTNLNDAKAQARQTHRPILSLRMLGDLTDEYSCANSRFFRVMLYADPMISSYLRDNFVLHWQSVRDVPQVTVTLSDGSTMRRTVTGNSVHMVLTEQGQVVDIIPGLWHPEAFLKQLKTGQSIAAQAQKAAGTPGKSSGVTNEFNYIRAMHASQNVRTQLAFTDRLTSLNMTTENLQNLSQRSVNYANRVARPAENAMPLAVTKSVAEGPLMRPIRLVNVQAMWQQMNLPNWNRFAASFNEQALLSEASWALIAAENKGDAQSFRQTLTESLASDTAFNQYFLKPQIHRLFTESPLTVLADDNAMTELLYREVLGMDLSDPWAGLHDPAVYTGLSQGGMIKDRMEQLSQNVQTPLVTE